MCMKFSLSLAAKTAIIGHSSALPSEYVAARCYRVIIGRSKASVFYECHDCFAPSASSFFDGVGVRK